MAYHLLAVARQIGLDIVSRPCPAAYSHPLYRFYFVKSDGDLAQKRPFNQHFASLYAADPASGLAYFLDTCQFDSRQIFQSKIDYPAARSRSEQLLRSYAHALIFQKNPVQALLIGDYLISSLGQMGVAGCFDLIAQIGNDLSSLSALSSGRSGLDRRADARRAALLPFWQKYASLLAHWGSIAPPLYQIDADKGNLRSNCHCENGAVCRYLDMWSLHQLPSIEQIEADSPLLLCFDSATTLLQALGREEIFKAFGKDKNLCGFWVFDEELEPQIEIQSDFFSYFRRCGEPSICWGSDPNKPPAAARARMQSACALLRSNTPFKRQLAEQTSHLMSMREHYFESMGEQLGRQSLLSVGLARDSADWFGASSRGEKKGPLDLWIEQMLGEIPVSKIERRSERRRWRLIHVVSQIVDQCHSPTQLLRQLIEFRNSENFEVSILSTERLTPRGGEYPQLERSSPSSSKRGEATLKWLTEKRVAIEFLNLQSGWIEGLAALRGQIEQIRPNILVFHGPDLLHLHLARSLEGPFKVLFEHGSLPRFRGFDLAIASTEDAPRLYGAHLKTLATKITALPFCSDRRAQWTSKSMGKSHLGLSNGDFAAITISNHLDKRLSPQFCKAVSTILSHCERMHYVAIGPVADRSNLLDRFEPDVQRRIHFPGQSPHPANLARAADLYFNEFPWGGCLGILDALAAGCPIVSMYDEGGPAQARYGGLFMGEDFAVASNDPDRYVELAKRLYREPLFYFKASQRAFARYEGRSNGPAYVREFEQIISKHSMRS